MVTALAIILVLIMIKVIHMDRSPQSDQPPAPIIDPDREALGGDIDETSYPQITYDPQTSTSIH